jgi:tRNA pseudouridine38-40 synthase
VEGVLTEALEAVAGEPVKLTAAGRTDAGVHARGQVASVILRARPEQDALADRLNGVLPGDVAVRAAEPVPGEFDARRDARSRSYCYRILARSQPDPFERGRALWVRRPLDLGVLEGCAAAIAGTHDFAAFTPTRTDHVRFERDVMRAEWRQSDRVLEFWIEADTFMRHMVRTLVGTMLEVSDGRRDPDSFSRLLEGASRSEAGPTAEPHGLYLMSVRY